MPGAVVSNLRGGHLHGQYRAVRSVFKQGGMVGLFQWAGNHARGQELQGGLKTVRNVFGDLRYPDAQRPVDAGQQAALPARPDQAQAY